MDKASNRQKLQPIATTHLFPELLKGLLELLTGLSSEDWARPIPRKSWSVKDVALHLLGGDVGVLSRERDGFQTDTKKAADFQELVEFLKAQNDLWIQGTRRISPRLLCDLLRFTGKQVQEYFQSLDPVALGGPVSWAGPEPAPHWFDIAREYTERWHHQQHIREAVGQPGFTEPRFLKPALDTFVRALPYTYRDVAAPEGMAIELTVSGDSGGTWLLLREQAKWQLYVGHAESANAAVAIPQEVAWKRFTKWLPREEVLRIAEVKGDRELALKVFDLTSVIA